jgi:hypothetical protein
MAFERVYTVWNYYDGPLTGLADYGATAHYFARKFDPAMDEYTNLFSLSPISDDTLQLALEQWAIWRAWELAFHSGKVALESHPGHGGRDARYDELKSTLDDQLGFVRALSGVFEGHFRVVTNPPDLPIGMLKPMEVEWRSS